MSRKVPAKAAKPLLHIDKKAKSVFKPYRHSKPMEIADTLAQVGDQLQMRLLCGGVIAGGLLRRDVKLASTGVRMLLAHELANFIKDQVKRRVDRTRPRSTAGRRAAKPRKGRSREKEQQSFPSGHSGGSVAVASVVGGAYPKLRVPALTAAGSVALVRVVAGAHYPSDVAAGATIGVVSGRLLTFVGRGLRRVARALL